MLLCLKDFNIYVFFKCENKYILLKQSIEYVAYNKQGAIMAELYITEKGKKEKEERLEYLKTVRRPEVLEKLKTAREYGDLSENSEYDAARAEQGRVESEINMIEETLRLAIIVSDDEVRTDRVHVGSTVTVYDEEMGENEEYKVVGVIESDPDRGWVSNESPIGKALMNKKKGEVVTINTPNGSYSVKIISIK